MSFKDHLAADLGIFFNTEEFAENITYKGVAVPAIVDRLQDPQFSGGNVATYARLHIKKSSVAVVQYLDEIVMDGKAWVVERVESSDSLVWVITARCNERYAFK